MNDIGVGAVGAAVIAGLVSLLGLIIGKEQKVSEFRQAWIDDLRKCLIAYLVNINAISDALQLQKAKKPIDSSALIAHYKSLNEASHGIVLRINADEEPAEALLTSMSNFDDIAQANANLTPENIRVAEQSFIDSSKALLKFEWKRVKRGEKAFVWTKWIVVALTLAMLALLGYLWATRGKVATDVGNSAQGVQLIQNVRTETTTHNIRRAEPREAPSVIK